MKFPAIALPNVENNDDITLLLIDGTAISASEFMKQIGGANGIRLMVSADNAIPGKVQLTTQASHFGDIYCASFPAARDRNGRIVSAAVIFRKEDAPQLEAALAFEKLVGASQYPIPSSKEVRSIVRNYELARHLGLKKKPSR
jgi:hypothetical protein